MSEQPDAIGLSARIASHVAGVSFDRLPDATIHATRRVLLDGLGVMLAASGLSADAAPYREHALRLGSGNARLIGSDERTATAAAAFANGALAHALDFGDTFDPGPAHPNAALIPALLAIVDDDPSIDGGRFLAAMAAGSDLACRLSLAPVRPYEEGGWYPPPLTGLIGAAAASAKLLGLDEDGIRHAMGLAMLQASFPAEIKYDPTSPVRGVREAFAARAAIEAAMLAQKGARAFAAPLEGRAGFFALYGGGEARPGFLDGLGERFLGDEVSFKPWPSCRGTHAYIEAALALRDQIGGREIRIIEAEIGPVQEMLIRPQALKAAPKTAIEAKFSIPFTTAHALVHGRVTLDSFSDAALEDRQVRHLAEKVHERRNPEWGRGHAASGSLGVELGSGERLHWQVRQAAGHPERPLSDEQLVDKFIDCASRARIPVDSGAAHALAAELLSLDGRRSAASLLRLVGRER